MGLILFGLVLVLDLPGRIAGMDGSDPRWWAGVAFASTAASAFAISLWITERRLQRMGGPVRSVWTLGIVFAAMVLSGVVGLVPGGMALPQGTSGWLGLAGLTLLYGAGFTTLFVTLPPLNMAQNAPVMNIEPVASLLLGWLVLQQTLAPVQLVGGMVVLAGIVWLARRA